MGRISVTGPQFGQRYNVNIAGEAPTPEEQARIDQFVTQQETDLASRIQERFGAPAPVAPEPQAPEDTGPDTSFGGALASAIDQPLENFATTSRLLGAEGFGDFLSGLTSVPENYQSATAGFINQDGSFYDFSYLPRAAVEQAGQLAGSLLSRAGGAALGGAAGSVVPGLGTAAGATAGAVAGPFLFEALQILGPIAQDRANNNGRETPNTEDWLAALGTSGVSGALNTIAPNASGFLRRLLIEGGTEGIQSLVQQAGSTAGTQAGLDINLREAGAEALLAGVTIGAFDAPGAIMRSRREPGQQLDEDIKEMINEGNTRLQYADQFEQQLEADQNASSSEPELLEGPSPVLALPSPQNVPEPQQPIADTEFDNLSFDKAQYERILQQVKADITSNKPINIPAIQAKVKQDIPGTTLTQIRDIMKELQARGFVAENPASKKSKFIPLGALAPQVKTPDVSYRRQIDSAAKFIKDDQARLERLNYDLRAAESLGRDLDGNKVTPNQVNQKIAQIEERIKKNQERMQFANERLATLGRDTHVPRIERVGVPPNVKAVPVAEGTVEALKPRVEAQQQAIKGLREQLNALNKQIRRLNDQAKKRQLSSIELSRMPKLQKAQADISARLGEAEANLKSPEKIFQEAKGEQFREQERQREIQRKLAAAQARAAADQVKAQEDRGLPPRTQQFTEKQARVFAALSKRLKNLGLKDVKLEGQQRIEGAEGAFDPSNKVMSLAMALYDPNMTDQQYFDALSEVMNHEVIHALRALGLLTDNEIKILEKSASRTKYVKRKGEGVEQRAYTYLDRAKRLYPDYTPEQQLEEAIAEMFRDSTAGRLKIGGAPANIFQRIKNFFKSLVGASRAEGFNTVEDIFQGIRRGDIGGRERGMSRAEQQAMQSRLPQDIVDRTYPVLSPQEVPQNTRKAYKLMKVMPSQKGIVLPLFAKSRTLGNVGFALNAWHRAVDASGKSLQIGAKPLARRPGIHAVGLPIFDQGKVRVKKERRVWVEVEMPAISPETQAESDATPMLNNGQRQGIRDRVIGPSESYDYKTNPNASQAAGSWPIAGSARIVRIVPDSEIESVLRQAGRDEYIADSLSGIDDAEAARMTQELADAVTGTPQRMESRLPTLPMAPEGTRAHNLPSQLLMVGDGKPARVKITQKYTPQNAEANNAAIQEILDVHPDALKSIDAWADAMQDALGGEFIPVPPMQAIKYAVSPEAMAEKLSQLTPELRRGVDEGFKHVEAIRDIYQSGNADPRMTLDLFVWGILSRGAGPVQQESAFIDIIDSSRPLIQKAVSQPLTDDDLDMWMNTVSAALPEGSPGKQVTMNVNAAGRLVQAMSQLMPGSNQTVLGAIHNELSDPNTTAAEVREMFMSNTQGSGIDNKVLSFILLVGGKDDVLVMDRIQGRHMWDDGRFGGANIYDGIGKSGEGLNGIFRGPRGILTTRILEDGMRRNVDTAYEIVGRPEDASLGRWHWETWVIEGEQVVNHDTLAAIVEGNPVGSSVTEGKTDTFSSGMTYRRGPVSTVVEYPLSNGGRVFMKPTRFKEFTQALADDAKKSKSLTGVFKEGKFKVTQRADIPWYERPEVDRLALDLLAMEYENAKPDGSILVGTERVREGQDASQRGNSDLDRRYSRLLSQSEEGDTARDGGISPLAKRIIQEVVPPEERPAAEVAASDLEPVTAQDLTLLQSNPEEFLRRPGWAVVSAITPEMDQRARKIETDIFRNRLDAEGVPYVELDGVYLGDAEPSFMIIAPRSTAELYGKQLRQESIITNEGLTYTLRPLAPTGSTGRVMLGEEARTQDSFSRTKDGSLEFSLDLKADQFPGNPIIPEGTYLRTDRPQLPIRKSDGMVELFHWSDQQLSTVDPAFAGTGPLRGAERRRGARLGFFGINPRSSQRERGTGYYKESGLGQIMHRALVDPNDLYPWVADPLGLKDNLTTVGYDAQTNEVEQRIKDAGYRGYYVEDNGSVRDPSAPLGNVAAMFEPVPVEPVEGRRAAQADRNQIQKTMQSRLLSTTALRQQVNEKKLDLTYARASDFIAKGLGLVLPKDRAQDVADDILVKFQDRMLPVGRMLQELQQKGLNITDAMDTYLKEELYHGIVGNEISRREQTIYKDAIDATKQLNVSNDMIDNLERVSNDASGTGNGFVKQARGESRSNKTTLAEAYLYARHAKERNAYMRRINPENQSGSGMTDREADAILNWFNGLDNNNKAAIAALDVAVRAIVADTNKVRIDSGLIPDSFDTIIDEDGESIPRPDYKYYVPLRGMFDPTAAEQDGYRGGGAKFGARGRPDPRALGRYSYSKDILANVINQNQQSVDRGERNKVGQSFLKLLRSNPELTKAYGRVLDRLPTQQGLVRGQVRQVTNFSAAQEPDIFVVKENGKDVYVQIPDLRIAQALKGDQGRGASSSNAVVRTMGTLNRYLSNINTSYNPEFFITNFLRDLQTAGVNVQQYGEKNMTRQIVKDVKGALRGIKRSIINKDDSSEWAQIYKDFVDAGGQNVLNQMSTISDQMNNIQNLVGDIADQGARGKWNQVKNSFVGKSANSLLSTIENYNTVVENGIRVATYKALLDRGFSRERAAQAARNVTVNFAKGGEYKTFMNAYSLFYNASLQGSFALLNAALRSRKVAYIWAAAVATGALQDQLNALLSGEDDDEQLQYDKIPDYILEHNLILPDPFGFTDRSYIAIPMPYGLNMAHNIGRASSRAVRGGYDAGEAASTIVGTIVDTINPLGGTESFANFAAPTIADPFIDIIENENFAGRPIYKDAFPGDRSPDSQRYWSTTNPSAVWVAQRLNELTGGTDAVKGFIDLSPDVLNFWLEYATGGVGRFIQRTAELPVRAYDGGLTEELYREIPFVRKIIGSVSEREDYGQYVEKRNSILEAGDELRAASDNADRERLLAARERYAVELQYLPRVRAIDNAIRQVNSQINRVRDANIPDERKRQLLDALSERKQALILRGNQLLADYQ